MDCSLPGSSVHGILQARILEWVAMPCSRGFSWPRDRTCISYVSCIGRQVLYHYHTWESQRRFQFSSVAQSCPTLCNPINRSTPGLPVHHQLLESTQTHVHWVGDAIQPSHPLSSLSPPALNLYQHQGLFKWINSPHQVAKYWSFSFNISPTNEHTGLISFRIDWLDPLAVQGTRKSLLQYHNSKVFHKFHSATKMAQTQWCFVSTTGLLEKKKNVFIHMYIKIALSRVQLLRPHGL